MKVGDKVTFMDRDEIKRDLGIGSGKAIGEIVDFDGGYVIIKTGLGEHYVKESDVVYTEGEQK